MISNSPERSVFRALFMHYSVEWGMWKVSFFRVDSKARACFLFHKCIIRQQKTNRSVQTLIKRFKRYKHANWKHPQSYTHCPFCWPTHSNMANLCKYEPPKLLEFQLQSHVFNAKYYYKGYNNKIIMLLVIGNYYKQKYTLAGQVYSLVGFVTYSVLYISGLFIPGENNKHRPHTFVTQYSACEDLQWLT